MLPQPHKAAGHHGRSLYISILMEGSTSLEAELGKAGGGGGHVLTVTTFP